MKKAEQRKVHRAIDDLSEEEVAAIFVDAQLTFAHPGYRAGLRDHSLRDCEAGQVDRHQYNTREPPLVPHADTFVLGR